MPVNKVVRIDLTSKDVIHSFFVPNMRLKQDAVPGRIIHVWFEATETGQYEIPCAELCGFGHSGMLGNLTVQIARGLRQVAQRSVRPEQVTPALAGDDARRS